MQNTLCAARLRFGAALFVGIALAGTVASTPAAGSTSRTLGRPLSDDDLVLLTGGRNVPVCLMKAAFDGCVDGAAAGGSIGGLPGARAGCAAGAVVNTLDAILNGKC